MHYLVVAKVKDYPDVKDLMDALSHGDTSAAGNWKLVADSLEDFIKANKDDIISEIDDDEMPVEDQALAYIELFGYHIASNGKIYEKVSSHFDSCVLGGRYTNEDITGVAPYQNVLDECGQADAFVLPEYELYYTDENECPFKPDDPVYIIDGHN